MPQHLCPRCQTALPAGDPGTLLFCFACGSPQVRLSDEHLDAQTAHDTATSIGPPSPWPGAIQIAALCAAFAGVLTLLSTVLPPVSLISFLWAVSAPLVVLRLFIRRFPAERITSGFGARLGLLTAFFLALTNATLNLIYLLLLRFAFHNSRDIDAAVAATFTPSAQTNSQMVELSARLGSNITAASLAASQHILTVPEFRVGIMLIGTLAGLGFYLLYASIAGALAGALRSRVR